MLFILRRVLICVSIISYKNWSESKLTINLNSYFDYFQFFSDIHADRLNQQRSCKTRQLRRRKWQNRINSWNSEAENHNQNQKHSMIVGSAQCSDTIGDRVMKTQQLNNDDKNSFSNPPSEEEAQCIPVVSSSHSINVSSNHHTAASQHGGSSRLSTSKESSGTSHNSSQSSYFLVSSPYLYHFLVLVLLTFAQSAGKPHQKLLLYYNL